MVRGGAGLYWETELLWRRLQERAAIGPVGNGRLQVPHTSFTNIFPGIINLNTGAAGPGRRGAAGERPGHQPDRRPVHADLQRADRRAAGGSSRRRTSTICRCATSSSARRRRISTRTSIRCSTAIHMSIGVQRELRRRHGARRRFRAPRLRRHAARIARLEPLQPLHQRRADAGHPALHDGRAAQRPERAVLERRDHVLDAGRHASVYNGAARQARQALLEPLPVRRVVRAHRSQRHQRPDHPNLDNYFESYGPTGARHLLNVSALVDLPGQRPARHHLGDVEPRRR